MREEKILILTGRLCPYCKLKTKYIDSSVIYGKSYGMIYLCKACDAYVGVHKGTNRALGRLANKELREAKKKAHFFFDQLWNKKMLIGFSKTQARKRAYKWLSTQLNLPINKTHIGMFDVEQCKKVIKFCIPYCKLKKY